MINVATFVINSEVEYYKLIMIFKTLRQYFRKERLKAYNIVQLYQTESQSIYRIASQI